MEFKYHKFSMLPRLSWCAVATSGLPDIHIYHGDGIETSENYFVEGAWDGDFCSANFDKSKFFMGSGGKLSENGRGGGSICYSQSHT